MSGEAVADWIKHAFIAKFNSLEPHVYADMERVLRKDIINLFNEDEDTDKVVFDHNYAITRRVGLSQVFIYLNIYKLIIKVSVIIL